MKFLTIAANKGGVGKTTLSALLAVKALPLYDKVYLVDLDPQQSLKTWWTKRSEDAIEMIEASYTNLEEVVKKIQKEKALLIIDTPPAHINIIKAAIKVAHFVLIPCRPSPLDVEAIGETISIVEEHKKKFAFVLNSSITGTQISEQTLMLLSQYGKISTSAIRQRVIYATAMIDGRTAIELASKIVNDEVSGLWNFVHNQLEKIND